MASAERGTLYDQGIQKGIPGAHTTLPALEDELEEFVLEQRAVCRGMNTVQLRMKAIELAKSHNIDNFKGNPSWCYRSMKCNNLAIRQRTTIAQLPADHVERLQPFRTFVQRQIDEHKIRNS